MNQSNEIEAFEEALDLERFVRAVRRMPTVPKSAIDKIDKIVAGAEARRIANRIARRRKQNIGPSAIEAGRSRRNTQLCNGFMNITGKCLRRNYSWS